MKISPTAGHYFPNLKGLSAEQMLRVLLQPVHLHDTAQNRGKQKILKTSRRGWRAHTKQIIYKGLTTYLQAMRLCNSNMETRRRWSMPVKF